MIGLFGGTCNNLYVFAKCFVNYGLSVTFIQDRKDKFPHSQPVWDDVECYFQTGFEYHNIDWDFFEQQHKWSHPSWYFVPDVSAGSSRVIFHNSTGDFLSRLFICRFLRYRSDYAAVFMKMLECDLLVVCGAEPALLAMLTGKPYVIVPHGSDMRIAVGAETKGAGARGYFLARLISRSFKKALNVISSLPDGSAEVPRSEYLRLKELEIERVPIPYQAIPRFGMSARHVKLQQLFSELNMSLPSAEYYAFIPSRINFHWKGHDRLLTAVLENKELINCHFIFLGWGDDYDDALAFVEQNNLDDKVTIVPVFCSKKFLFRFFEAVDFIVDSLNGSGTYGTSLSEAMSCGCPVMTWISDIFDKPGWEAPPVIHAKTKEEIASALIRIGNGQIDLDVMSMKTVDWFGRVHSEKSVMNVFLEKFGKYFQ